jgi:hypothetical protein
MEKSLKMPKGIQNRYIEEEQKQHHDQKKKYKRTNNDLQNINADKIPQIWFRVFMLTSKLLIQESHVAIGCLKRFLYQINVRVV